MGDGNGFKWIIIGGIILLALLYYNNPEKFKGKVDELGNKLNITQSMENMTLIGKPNVYQEVDCVADKECLSMEQCSDGSCLCIDKSCWK